jgi:glycosyltransferase involved in cell wall biosynthesis
MIRAMLLNIWAGAIARLFVSGRRFKTVLFYSPQFAFFRLFLRPGHNVVWAYDKADAYSLFYKGAVRKAIAFLDEYNTAHADLVLASSHELEILAKRQGAKRTSEVDNGIYSETFAPRSQRDKMLAVYVGNLVQDMWGVDMLLEAVPNVAREFPSFHIAVIGEGPLKVEYQSICRKLGINNRAKFHGYVPHEKIGDVICSARVAVAPYKSFPAFRFSSSLKILEYLAAGTPVVVSNVGPFADMVSSERLGFVVEAAPEKIADGIASILRLNDEEWEAMSQRALTTARKYEWDTIILKAFDEIEKTRAYDDL